MINRTTQHLEQGDGRRTSRPVRLFLLWLGLLYGAWLAVVTIGSLWTTVAVNWPIAAAMGAGSYFAGSTPLGGGTVGFPMLVLLFDESAALGRDFSLSIQSIGMVSASVFILLMRRHLAWALLRWAIVGTLIGAPLGAWIIAPVVGDLQIKLLFAVIWCSFGLMNAARLRTIIGAKSGVSHGRNLDLVIGLTIGILGGIATSLTGVGINMILYATLVLFYRADLKVAIPTAVVAMAFASLVGLASHVALGNFDSSVFSYWIAAAPIAIISAPIGVWMVHLIPRTPTMLLVSALCVGQFVWMLVDQRVGGGWLVGSLIGVVVFLVVFQVMFVLGGHVKRE